MWLLAPIFIKCICIRYFNKYIFFMLFLLFETQVYKTDFSLIVSSMSLLYTHLRRQTAAWISHTLPPVFLLLLYPGGVVAAS